MRFLIPVYLLVFFATPAFAQSKKAKQVDTSKPFVLGLTEENSPKTPNQSGAIESTPEKGMSRNRSKKC